MLRTIKGVNGMQYEFTFYKDEDYNELIQLALLSYGWDYPVVGLSRLEFCHGLHPEFTGNKNAWYHTVGVYRAGGKVVACVWNEGNYDGEVFFLFDSRERADDMELIRDMVKFAKTTASGLENDRRTRKVNLYIPTWHESLKKHALEHGFTRTEGEDQCYILPFHNQKMEVSLPEGYKILDGTTTPDFYLSNTHRFAFNYGGNYHFLGEGIL